MYAAAYTRLSSTKGSRGSALAACKQGMLRAAYEPEEVRPSDAIKTTLDRLTEPLDVDDMRPVWPLDALLLLRVALVCVLLSAATRCVR
eukprot:2611584-Rhodomonas_salina.1